MILSTEGYNIPMMDVTDTTITLDTKTTVGTKEDFDTIMSLCQKSGIVLGKYNAGGVTMIGAMLANPWASGDKIEFTTITSGGAEAPYILYILFELDGTVAKATFTKVTIGN